MTKWVTDAAAMVNIAKELSKNQLTKIAGDVETGHSVDKESRAEWETRQDQYMKLALQVMEEKNSPWPKAANVKYPLLTSATMQFGARAYPALVTSPSIVKGRVTGYDPTGEKGKSAERIGKHMSYQLIEEMEEWEDDMDKLTVSIPILGCMFKKTYFNPTKGRNVSELVYPKNLVVNYWTTSLKDCQRITHELSFTDNDIYERVASGLYLDQDYTKKKVEPDQTSDQVHGTSAPDDDTTPYLVLEQHTWIDLDEDGYKEPYIVTVIDGKVARIVARYDLDKVKVFKNKIICIEPIHYFTKYGFVPNPDGSFYDVGFGLLLGPINETINTTINQLLDAGTLSNRQSGFIGRGLRMKGGNKDFSPGEWKQALSTGDDLRKSIVPLPVREPSMVLFQLLGLMIEAGKELSSTVPMIMGQNPGQNQPATTSMSVIEQGLKVFSAIFKRMHRALKQELKKLKRLNRIYLPPETYFSVLDDQEGQEQVFQRDYSEDVTDVQPYSDPNIVSEVQRVIKANQVSELMQKGQIPNPQAAVKIILEAMDLPNVEELMTPPEPGPNIELMELELKTRIQDFHEFEVRAKIKMEAERLLMDGERADNQSVKDESAAILNYAKAAAEEHGIEMDSFVSAVEGMLAKKRADGPN